MSFHRGGGGGGDGAPAALDRAISCLPYLLPLLDSLAYGRYLFDKFPLLAAVVLRPLLPVYSVYRSVPFLPFGIFLALLLLVVRNGNLSRFARFNTMQSLALDIAIILPQLLLAGVQATRVASVSPVVVETLSNAVFYGMLGCVLYASASCVRGALPDKIPLISDAASAQLGPF